jgi:CBS-domain-containing membrane protein
MRAADVMTQHVITVDGNATVQGVAALLSERGISGVPVVDEGNRVIGMVSEGDLIHRQEIGTERRRKRSRSWWLQSDADQRHRLHKVPWPQSGGRDDERGHLGQRDD